ncbi:expressed unknown protein [Seminavis robusta]|uniref:SH3 domain-containing protein n=1 Tax=Seminavis robusta TaxID=568900 RepID=A0A9N8DDG3_9STRA|nr:expressed unknown protein [Seminavis robusta]|eukprot:Sro91_g047820.1 n/a (505) ;mRNA; r:95599-97874
MQLIAKFPFQGNPGENQLTFPAGAIIDETPNNHTYKNTVNNNNGWLHGTYQNQRGWFPADFVQPLVSPSMPPPRAPEPEANIVLAPMAASMPMASAVPITDNGAARMQDVSDSRITSASTGPMLDYSAASFASLPPPSRKKLDNSQISQLIAQGFTRGLAESLDDAKQTFAKRIWVVDNSGSMQKTDGHRLVDTGRRKNLKFVACSRWEEITECVCYHIQLAALIQAPTSFRFLNDPGAHVGPQQFTIDTSMEAPDYHGKSAPYNTNANVSPQEALKIVRKARPGGCTPLTDHILAIQSELEAMTPQLRANGQKVAVVIATDGLPTDERGYGGDAHQLQFVDALRTLEGYPVWLVIRLCTDEEKVVEFYNDLDSLLELSMEVLDDFEGEASEVHEHNAWLNYALPLHRMREMGYHDRVFDMLDERRLTKSELSDFVGILVGGSFMDGMPDPNVDWESFLRRLDSWLKQKDHAPEQWNPMKKKLGPWLDLRKMHHDFGEGSCVIL